MVIGSFVVKAAPGAADRVAARLRAISTVTEVRLVPDSDDLAVTADAETKGEMERLAMEGLPSVEEVAGVYLTYVHFHG